MARKTIASLSTIINDLNREISENKKVIEGLNNKINSSQENILELEKHKSDNNKKTDELNSIITTRDSKIEELNNIVSDRDENINILNSNISERDSKIEELNLYVTDRDKEIEDLSKDISSKNTDITECNSEIQKLKLSLEQFEVRKFAVAFENEKNEYNEKISIWRPISIYSFIILLFVTFIITIISFYIGTIDKISLLFIESVAVLFTIFSVKQYLFYTSHYSDALRRQTLAQGYQHILEGEDDKEIKPEYKEKLVNVLCDNEKKDNKYKFPQERLVDKVKDLSETMTKYLGKQ